jgi:hypothetical protein
MVVGGVAKPDRMARVDAAVSGINIAIMAGAAALPADTRANLWNLSPGERAGQSGGRPATVMKYIAPEGRFFQLEMGGKIIRI